MRVASLAALLALVLPAVARPADSPPERTIRYERDTLTVAISGVQLGEVVSEVGRQAGAEIRGGLKEDRAVTAQFEQVPLADALHRLLGEQNFALIYGQDGQLRAIRLLGGPSFVTPMHAAAPAPLPPPYETPAPANLLGLFESHAPVPVSGRLAQALGSDNATLAQLMSAGLHNEDRLVRADAVRTGLNVVDSEPALRSSVMNVLNSMPDVQVRVFLQNMAGQNAEEFARLVSTQSRSADLRGKAMGVLRELRNPTED